jgi:hypothetical protein
MTDRRTTRAAHIRARCLILESERDERMRAARFCLPSLDAEIAELRRQLAELEGDQWVETT